MRKVLILFAFATLPVTAYAADESAPSAWFSEILAIWDDITATVSSSYGWIDPAGLSGEFGNHVDWNDPSASQEEAEQAIEAEEPSAMNAAHFGWIDPVGLNAPTDRGGGIEVMALPDPVN